MSWAGTKVNNGAERAIHLKSDKRRQDIKRHFLLCFIENGAYGLIFNDAQAKNVQKDDQHT